MKIYQCIASFHQYYKSPITYLQMNILANNEQDAFMQYKIHIESNSEQICRLFEEKNFEINSNEFPFTDEDYKEVESVYCNEGGSWVEKRREPKRSKNNIMNIILKTVRIYEISLNNLSIETHY